MAFKSDRKERRTWDPDTGWELHRGDVGRDHIDFELRHPAESPIFVTVDLVAMTKLGGATPEGFERVHIKYDVISIHGPPTGATPAQRQLIVDALTAYGIGCNGPLGPVDVAFTFGA